MNKLWNLQNYSAEALHRTVRRDGLRIRQEKVPPIFRAQVAFPLRESADYAIIGLLLKIACFGGNLRKP